jgi:hypothetical protein
MMPVQLCDGLLGYRNETQSVIKNFEAEARFDNRMQ